MRLCEERNDTSSNLQKGGIGDVRWFPATAAGTQSEPGSH